MVAPNSCAVDHAWTAVWQGPFGTIYLWRDRCTRCGIWKPAHYTNTFEPM